jgi:hypothetical protein
MLSFFSIGIRVRLTLFLSAAVPLNFFAGPEFDRGQSEWKTFAGHCKTGMHQDAANGVRSEASSLVPSTVDIKGDTDRLAAFTLKREFGRVVQNKDEALAAGKTDHGLLGNGLIECLPR